VSALASVFQTHTHTHTRIFKRSSNKCFCHVPDRVKVLTASTQKLSQVNGGGKELGTSWKEGLTGEETFDASVKLTEGSLDQAYGQAIKARATKVVEATCVIFWWGLQPAADANSWIV
jgi:hypothetical protein